MKSIRFLFGSFLFVALCAAASPAQQRTFVSGGGNDANPCTRVAPCRTFGQALSLTSPGGEVIVLDSAGYGPFTVSTSVSIIAPAGVYAGISVFSGDGIDITASASDTVILRGLTVNNQGSNGEGIVHRSGGILHVESCIVNGFSSGPGLDFTGSGQLEVKDCIMRGNSDGIDIRPFLFQSSRSAAIDHVRLEGNLNKGLLAEDGSQVTVTNTVASDNEFGFFGLSNGSAPVQMSLESCIASFHAGSGVAALSVSTGPVDVNIESCVVSNNGSGISAASTSSGVATVRVSNSTVTGNNTGLLNQSGAPALLLSRGNNTVAGNKVDTSGTIGSYTAF